MARTPSSSRSAARGPPRDGTIKPILPRLSDPGVDKSLPDLPANQLDKSDQTRDALTGQLAEWDKPDCACDALLSIKICPHGFGQPVDVDGSPLTYLAAYLAQEPIPPEGEGVKEDNPNVSLADVHAERLALDVCGPPCPRGVSRLWYVTEAHPEGITLLASSVGRLPDLPIYDPDGVGCSWWNLRGYVEDGLWVWDQEFSPDHGMPVELWSALEEAESPVQFSDRAETTAAEPIVHDDRLNTMILRSEAGQVNFCKQDFHQSRAFENDRVSEKLKSSRPTGALIVNEQLAPKTRAERFRLEALVQAPKILKEWGGALSAKWKEQWQAFVTRLAARRKRSRQPDADLFAKSEEEESCLS